MLREMTWEQFGEWKAFEELEPFSDERDDWRTASIVQALWNIARDSKKNPEGWPLSEFLLAFGDTPRPAPVRQSIETQTLLIEAWCDGSNEVIRARNNKR